MLARFSPTIITLAAIGFLCGPGLAHADGTPRAPRGYSQYAEPTYQPYDWSGFYLGGHVGGVYSATDWLTGTLEEVEHSSTNFVGGAHSLELRTRARLDSGPRCRIRHHRQHQHRH